MSFVSWGDIFTLPLGGDRIMELRQGEYNEFLYQPFGCRISGRRQSPSQDNSLVWRHPCWVCRNRRREVTYEKTACSPALGPRNVGGSEFIRWYVAGQDRHGKVAKQTGALRVGQGNVQLLHLCSQDRHQSGRPGSESRRFQLLQYEKRQSC